MSFLEKVKRTAENRNQETREWLTQRGIEQIQSRIKKKASSGGWSVYVGEHWGVTEYTTNKKEWAKKEGFTIIDKKNGFRISWA
jgi:hypothetical protein